MYAWIYVFNSKTWPNSYVQDIKLRNWTDLDFTQGQM